MKYAALITKQIYVPGDERSRTHPGHGYPAGTVDSIRVEEFATVAAMEAWVREQQRFPGGDKYRLIQYEELEIETKISVAVKKR